MEDIALVEINSKRLVRKLDVRIVPYLVLLSAVCFLDRVSIGHARLYGLEESLKLSQGEYSWILSIFFVGYVLFEIPSNLVMKKVSPPTWIARIMVTWGIVTMCMAATTNFSGLMAARFFLGVSEAGLFPGIIFLMSFWYTRQEQGIRIVFLSASSRARLGSKLALHGERDFLICKLEASHVDLELNKFSLHQFSACFRDMKMYLYALLYLGLQCPMYSLSLLMPTIINNMGVNKVTTMLLTSPPCALAFVITIINAWHSDRTLNQGFHIMATCTLAIFGFTIMILATPLSLRYAAIMVIMVGTVASFPPTLSWLPTPVFIIAISNLGGFFSGWMYRSIKGPRYIASHLINIGMLSVSILCAITLRFILKSENLCLDSQEVSTSELDLPKGEMLAAISINPNLKFHYIL
ncbi:hypothetical protein L0F63_003848 [Massospora cicadina]|nr:hypothetical protein L0F63_003848 [Massospora cicadina]